MSINTTYFDRFRQWLKLNAESESESRVFQASDFPGGPVAAFWVVVVLGVTLVCLFQADWVFSGEMWAEMATNYFKNAISHSWMDRLFATDVGYFPLPQRWFSLLLALIGVPAHLAPYAYTWSAIVGAAVLSATFCLSRFRRLIPSDSQRFVLALVVVMMMDFQSRTYLNFTYLGAFFLAVLAATVVLEPEGKVPKWAWISPALMISKPVVLIAVPMLLWAAWMGKRQSRAWALICLICGSIQMMFLISSRADGWFAPKHAYTVGEKLVATVQYSTSLLGRFWVGVYEGMTPLAYVLIGLLLMSWLVWSVLRSRGPVLVLALCGMCLLVGCQALNAFVLSDDWNVSKLGAVDHPLYRYTLPSYWGSMLMFCALISAMTPHRLDVKTGLLRYLPTAALLLWFVLAGWALYFKALNALPGSPDLGNSQWQNLSRVIGKGQTACIPINPYGWFFGFNCKDMYHGTDRDGWQGFVRWDGQASSSLVSTELPDQVRGRKLQALGLVVKPKNDQRQIVEGKVLIEWLDGTASTLIGQTLIDGRGGMLYMMPDGAALMLDRFRKLTITTSVDVDYGFVKLRSEEPELAMMWMGQ